MPHSAKVLRKRLDLLCFKNIYAPLFAEGCFFGPYNKKVVIVMTDPCPYDDLLIFKIILTPLLEVGETKGGYYD